MSTYAQSMMLEVSNAMICQFFGSNPTNPNQRCLGIDSKTGKIGFVENGSGVIGFMAQGIAVLYTPPVEAGEYISYLGRSFGFPQKSYAAPTTGTGFEGLSPILSLWVAFRNTVYILFLAIFLLIGIAIMLRVRIDPRTVMTIQNQIPKIIIGLIMVTFSFAIAGALIDLMYVSVYLVTNLIGSAAPSLQSTINAVPSALNPFDALQQATKYAGGIQPLGGIVGTTSDTVGNLAAGAFDNPGGHAIFGLLGVIIGAVLGGKVAGVFGAIPVVGGIIGAVVGGIVGAVIATQLAGAITKVLALLIIGAAVIVTLLRLWITLISAYIFILIDVVLAPFWIVLGLVPASNNQLGFGPWIRDLVANLSAFPVTIGMFLLGVVFMEKFGTSQTHLFVPPLIGSIATPNIIGAIIGLGIIFTTPQAIVQVRKALKAPGINLGAVASAISGGTGVIGGGAKSAARTFMKTPTMGQRGGIGGFVRGLAGI